MNIFKFSPLQKKIQKLVSRLTLRKQRSGMALVLVLSAVVLITGLAISLLMRVNGGRTISSAYSKGVEARILADSTVNIVIGQIRDATWDGSLAWASQPGAIRTYDTTGAFNKGFKLYSSSEMVTTSEESLATDDAANMSNWKNLPGQYVDLNEPVVKADGIKHYPIMNPALMAKGSSGTNTNGTVISGFYMESTASSNLTDGQMPVEWLYVLKDGTLASGTYKGGKVSVPSATYGNPIQARIAFWTDDETAKININTASEGLFWDLPRAHSCFQQSGDSVDNYKLTAPIRNSNVTLGQSPAVEYERGLAYIQPGSREYNRYPGHPAMNCLSVLFEKTTTNENSPSYEPALATQTLSKIFQFARFMSSYSSQNNGSAMGTVQMNMTSQASAALTAITASALYRSPLYASIDEAAMVSSTNSGDYSGENPRLPSNQSQLLFTPDDIEKREFLMTANSRAPELNIFNRPRVAMWPISTQTLSGYRTAYDNLIEHCCTIRNRDDSSYQAPFVFERKNAYSGTDDGQIQSNIDIYTYLQELASAPIPGYGKSMKDKYSLTTTNTLLAEMLDYIRCTNVFDSSLEYLNGKYYDPATMDAGSKNRQSVSKNGAYEYTIGIRHPNATISNSFPMGYPGHGQVVPLKITGKSGAGRGLGRTPTISEVALLIICTGRANNDKNEGSDQSKATTGAMGGAVVVDSNDPAINKTLNNIRLNSFERRFQAILLLELVNPMGGTPYMVPSLQASVKNLDQLQIGSTGYAPQSVFPAGTLIAATPLSLTAQGAASWFGINGSPNMGFMPFLGQAYASSLSTVADVSNIKLDHDPQDANSGSTYEYQLISKPFTMKINDPKNSRLKFQNGGNVIIELAYYDAANTTDVTKPSNRQVYQTFTLNLSSLNSQVSTPIMPDGGIFDGGNWGRGTYAPWAFWSFNRRNGVINSEGSREDHAKAGRMGFTDDGKGTTWGYNLRPDLLIFPDYDACVSLQIKNGDYRVTAAKEAVATSDFYSTPLGPAIDVIGASPSWSRNGMAHSLTMNAYPFYTSTPFSNPIVSSGDRTFTVTGVNLYNVIFNVGGTVSSNISDRTQYNSGFFTSRQYGPTLEGSLVSSSKNVNYNEFAKPDISIEVTDSYNTANGWYGDWDNGLASMPDGPYCNYTDQGNMFQEVKDASDASRNYKNSPPYFFKPTYEYGVSSFFFSPNRIVPSSGMFGSLPISAWRTLLFRPEGTTRGSVSATAGSIHPGAKNPPDHLFMDWFWMPVVEPYAISEPFSTAGKVNMNYQILPFKHIVRKTALYSVLKAEKIMAIPSNQGGGVGATGDPANANGYKINGIAGTNGIYRHSLNIGETLKQFDQNYFSKNKIFKSATEICDQYLIPQGSTLSSMPNYWSDKLLTGDNTKERPYANIYPRLTTKSNTFRVHYRVQVLQKAKGNADNMFVDPDDATATGMKDQIMSEMRGSYLIERYLEYDDERFGVDSGFSPYADTLNKAYLFRIVSVKQFTP